MKSSKRIMISTAILAVALAVTLFSVPAVADDFGPASRIEPYSDTIGPYEPNDTIGPYERHVLVNDPSFRADEGPPGSKKPGAYSGSGKALAMLSFKLGSMRWRIKLVHPVWIPALSIFSRPGICQ